MGFHSKRNWRLRLGSGRIRGTGYADDVRCLVSDERAVDRRGELSGVQEHEGGKDGKGKGREKSRLFI